MPGWVISELCFPFFSKRAFSPPQFNDVFLSILLKLCVPVSKAQAYICLAPNNLITLKCSVKMPSLLLKYLLRVNEHEKRFVEFCWLQKRVPQRQSVRGCTHLILPFKWASGWCWQQRMSACTQPVLHFSHTSLEYSMDKKFQTYGYIPSSLPLRRLV